ncbi:MAG TPA: RNA polymerase sigma factor [Kofleriaceae bacterium]|nr:RNA polymerase sigma factor [Kofleriaceae bacterium]
MTSWTVGAVLGVLADVSRPLVADEDVALVERARGGDRDAFEALYRRHVAAVYARLSRLVGPVAEREDLTQDVFLGFHRALARFRGEAAPKTLLHRITVNVAIDHLRRRGRRPVEALDASILAQLVDDGDGPEERARRAQRLARVLSALETIAPKKRVALLLRVVEELSFEEIGALVGANAEAVKKRAQHGLRELTALLGAPEEVVP